MNINYELLQFYIHKKLVRREDSDAILRECDSQGISVRDYLLSRDMVTEETELTALAGYYCMPCVDMDMLEIDRSLVDLFAFGFMKKHKLFPVCYDEN